jgi:Mlc titration factor MtfA (ptsG expression regulator)
MRWPFARASRAPVDRSDWIADDAWHALIESEAFLARLDVERRGRLRAACGAFLATKAINGAAGLVVDEAVVARIVVQACLPILELGVEAYPRFDEIIVYPSDFIIDRESVDEDGVVHRWREFASGESWDDGPLVLAWDAADAAPRSRKPASCGFNVVIHEFAHKLDAGNGAIDGVPAFSRRLHGGLDAATWRDVMDDALDDFTKKVDAAEASIPRHVDPESARADRYYASLPLDAYAATDEAEFFSVSSEAFFVAPGRLRSSYPRWYGLLVSYYLQDPGCF